MEIHSPLPGWSAAISGGHPSLGLECASCLGAGCCDGYRQCRVPRRRGSGGCRGGYRQCRVLSRREPGARGAAAGTGNARPTTARVGGPGCRGGYRHCRVLRRRRSGARGAAAGTGDAASCVGAGRGPGVPRRVPAMPRPASARVGGPGCRGIGNAASARVGGPGCRDGYRRCRVPRRRASGSGVRRYWQTASARARAGVPRRVSAMPRPASARFGTSSLERGSRPAI
jgi:hypothetical protein